MNDIQLIIDIIARIIIPIVIPIVVTLIGRRVVINVSSTRSHNFNNLLLENAKNGTEEEQEFLKKTLDKVYSLPQMKWYR